MSDTLHEVLARGIDRGLRDVGAELSGCTPSMLAATERASAATPRPEEQR